MRIFGSCAHYITTMNLRVLVATASSDELLFLQEVFDDIQSDRHWHGWVNIQTMQATSMDQAVAVLNEEPADAVVADLALCGARALDAFRRLQTAGPRTPVILIAQPGQAELAARLIREGAQDFLLAHMVDAELLAHALWSAIERHRLLCGARAARMEDPMTGLWNRTAFLALADRDRRLAEKFGCRWMVALVEPLDRALPIYESSERRDLLVIETAEWLRRVAGPADMVARVGDLRFGWTVFESAGDTVEAAWARAHAAAQENRMAVGAAIFHSEHPSSLETLMEQAESDLAPRALAMRT